MSYTFFQNLKRSDRLGQVLGISGVIIFLVFLIGALVYADILERRQISEWEWAMPENPGKSYGEVLTVNDYNFNKRQLWLLIKNDFINSSYKLNIRFKDSQGVTRITTIRVKPGALLRTHADILPWVPIENNSVWNDNREEVYQIWTMGELLYKVEFYSKGK